MKTTAQEKNLELAKIKAFLEMVNSARYAKDQYIISQRWYE